eukprot:2150807-Rhodomonas_salina.6
MLQPGAHARGRRSAGSVGTRAPYLLRPAMPCPEKREAFVEEMLRARLRENEPQVTFRGERCAVLRQRI